mmetsp:Transcript_67290/g.219156  ORF Transcript_67290/g.219156 Transcript_67290/m.219156 type:complete len:317 (-) Transcript_67290:230-1180(-)|eukprot:CAMPEP_0204133710 /NCGR_PEP_ID=MMETSP0361-20130328/15255_1 /ASSEMBLY_ACC=CAM_ASM_000343 /TAXON_ID=268821 /ORGANISM="Scrippsiella Hangoei, Strain SHTV-5" /LENGTH=316 /DNA_ID=CAMNT_0051086801 /DNA_START=55 /DNA_END=1005 /DNA_ORIENTATION=-
MAENIAFLGARGAIEDVIAKRKLRFRFMRHDAWENALFVHWPVDPAFLAERLPRGLEPDILDGSAWVGLVLLTERGVSAYHTVGRRLVPPLDHLGANVRTYVRHNGVPGIFFWSLECSSLLASIGARLAGIPYCPAAMWRRVDVARPVTSRMDAKQLPRTLDPSTGISGCLAGLMRISGLSEQASASASASAASTPAFEFGSSRAVGRGRPAVSARWRRREGHSSPDDEEKFKARARWFVERYSVYAAWPWGRGPILLRGDVQHPSWPLEAVDLEALDAEPLVAAAGLPGVTKAAEPHVCFSRGVGPVDFWMLEPV